MVRRERKVTALAACALLFAVYSTMLLIAQSFVDRVRIIVEDKRIRYHGGVQRERMPQRSAPRKMRMELPAASVSVLLDQWNQESAAQKCQIMLRRLTMFARKPENDQIRQKSSSRKRLEMK